MIVVDIETSGLDFKINGILSIGAVSFENAIKTGVVGPSDQFYVECRIGEDNIADDTALKINGFSKERCFDESYMDQGEAISQFVNWTKKTPTKLLLGNNVHFDVLMLRYKASKFCVSWPFGHRFMDIHSIATSKIVEACSERGIEIKSLPESHDLNNLYQDKIYHLVGLGDEPQPHHGLLGAAYEAETLYRLLYGKVGLIKQLGERFPEIPDLLPENL